MTATAWGAFAAAVSSSVRGKIPVHLISLLTPMGKPCSIQSGSTVASGFLRLTQHFSQQSVLAALLYQLSFKLMPEPLPGCPAQIVSERRLFVYILKFCQHLLCQQVLKALSNSIASPSKMRISCNCFFRVFHQ
ncbi:unnamed protein product [Durusdinium trenchii]|uniref:Secreted protein n=1 Tax=Durusdinium trenchii TaxID=1381693 RepID=A0ABP0J3X3_9DINO